METMFYKENWSTLLCWKICLLIFLQTIIIGAYEKQKVFDSSAQCAENDSSVKCQSATLWWVVPHLLHFIGS